MRCIIGPKLHKSPVVPASTSPADPHHLAALGQLAAKVAHELNNPLDGIIRYIALAQRQIKSGHTTDVERYLADAQFGLQRMADVLRELLEFGHAATPPHPAPRTELDYLVQQAIATFSAPAQQHHVHICYQPATPRNLSVPPQLYQVLCNLVKNALDALPNGGTIMITTAIDGPEPKTPATPPPSLAANPSYLVLSISDTGPGIANDDLPHVFEPFFTRKPIGHGTGLGLAVCKELMDRMQGLIFARNRSEGGCSFVLRLPLTRPVSVEPTPPAMGDHP